MLILVKSDVSDFCIREKPYSDSTEYQLVSWSNENSSLCFSNIKVEDLTGCGFELSASQQARVCKKRRRRTVSACRQMSMEEEFTQLEHNPPSRATVVDVF